jgi:hypothetical protein
MQKQPDGSQRIISIDLGTRNLAVWSGSWDRSINPPVRIHYWNVIDLGTNQMNKACENMIRVFGGLPWMSECKGGVYVESQGKRGKHMKRLGNAIQTYFIMLGYPATHVRFISARQKLEIFDKLYSGPSLESTYIIPKDKYKARKAKASIYTGLLLTMGISNGTIEPSWGAWFSSLTKDDDAADSFLQGLSVLYDMNT